MPKNVLAKQRFSQPCEVKKNYNFKPDQMKNITDFFFSERIHWKDHSSVRYVIRASRRLAKESDTCQRMRP